MPEPESKRGANAPSRIRLIGYRGSGKSAVAQALALRLGWDWIDADVELELRTGRSIAAIFADEGEQAFRELEAVLLAELAGRERVVLATGGGIVLRAENRTNLRSGALVVWLKARPETIFHRTASDSNTVSRRPNLTAIGGLEEIRELLALRAPLYQQCANFEVDTDEKTVSKIAEEILNWLQSSAGKLHL